MRKTQLLVLFLGAGFGDGANHGWSVVRELQTVGRVVKCGRTLAVHNGVAESAGCGSRFEVCGRGSRVDFVVGWGRGRGGSVHAWDEGADAADHRVLLVCLEGWQWWEGGDLEVGQGSLNALVEVVDLAGKVVSPGCHCLCGGDNVVVSVAGGVSRAVTEKAGVLFCGAVAS